MKPYKVSRTLTALVAPCDPTPTGTLPLSPIDKVVGFRAMAVLMHVFSCGKDTAKTIRTALARTLVPYYPIAGRLVESAEGELQVACTGEGVWFAEATANCSLDDVDHLSQPLMVPAEDLLPAHAVQNEHPNLILMMQVTNFTCGGFAVCVGVDHSLFDATGKIQFLRAVGDMARGLERPMVVPIWCREHVPGPAKYTAALLSDQPAQWCTLDMAQDGIDHIKDEYHRETGQRCTTFGVLAAMIWQCRTRAIRAEPQARVEILFLANARPLLQGVLPTREGYYGNCLFPLAVRANAGWLTSAPLGEVVGLVVDAKERMAGEFWKWTRGQQLGEESVLPYESLAVSDLRRIGCGRVDYGWGPPIQTVPMGFSGHFPPGAALVRSPPPKRGVRLLTRMLRAEHLPAFRFEIARAAGAAANLHPRPRL